MVVLRADVQDLTVAVKRIVRVLEKEPMKVVILDWRNRICGECGYGRAPTINGKTWCRKWADLCGDTAAACPDFVPREVRDDATKD